MRNLSIWILAWRSLAQQPLRSVFSALTVALGGGMLVGASVAGSGIESMIEINESMIDFFTVVLEIIFSIIGGIILVAAGFLIFNAFAMSVLQRNKQIGMMRALGSSPKQIRQQLLAESFMVGGLGSLIGIAIGPFLGRLVLEMMVYSC
ncbi:MAG: FtsX-like permease family protein [Chloroflexi bacterium]|nr:FtsX-like permease family protein [Chloroflexota bacterium]